MLTVHNRINNKNTFEIVDIQCKVCLKKQLSHIFSPSLIESLYALMVHAILIDFQQVHQGMFNIFGVPCSVVTHWRFTEERIISLDTVKCQSVIYVRDTVACVYIQRINLL